MRRKLGRDSDRNKHLRDPTDRPVRVGCWPLKALSLFRDGGSQALTQFEENHVTTHAAIFPACLNILGKVHGLQLRISAGERPTGIPPENLANRSRAIPAIESIPAILQSDMVRAAELERKTQGRETAPSGPRSASRPQNELANQSGRGIA